MKKIFIIFILFLAVYLSGSQFQILQEPVEVTMHAGFVNLPDKDRYDINGDLCGMLIVRTGIEEMNIDSPMRHRQINKAGEYWVVLSPGTSYVDLKKVDYATLMVDFRQSIHKIEAGKVYEMTIDGDGGGEFLPVSIIAEPSGAEKWLDGELLGTEDTFTIKKGEHLLEVKKSGYKNYTKNITVEEGQVLFRDITLEKQRPVMLTITTEPEGAELYLNNVKEGVTNIQPFRFPDEYQLKLVLENYSTVEAKITVTENGVNTWHYDLEKETSVLSVNVTPPSADVYVNNQKLSGTQKEVSAGQYLIEVSKDGWYSQSKTVEVVKGINKSVDFILKQMTGSLQVTISPMESKSVLKRTGEKDVSWTGSTYQENLPVGEYELITSLSGYGTQTNKVKVKEKETASLKVVLEKEKEVIPSQKTVSGNIEMVFVEGGTFQMGSDDEKPVHSVTVSDFYIGKYEVTQGEYKAVMGKNPSSFTSSGNNAPVEQVSWYDAVEYCNKLSEKEGLKKCYSGSGESIKRDFSANGYRLPTEAEWEYAARGGNKSKGYHYSGSNDIGSVAWYNDNSGSKTHSIGSKQANELGIYDMSGNVLEWCCDWYGDYSSSAQINPRGPGSGSYRVGRGGGWFYDARSCSTAYRRISTPASSNLYIGFRLSRANP